MKLPFKHLIHLAAALAVMVFSANIVSACKCGEKATVEEEFARSFSVAVMRLESIDENNRAHLTVEKVFKGYLTPGREMEVRQVRELCQYIFDKEKIGGSYLVYVGTMGLSDSAGLPVHACSRTASVASAALDLQYLENLSPERVKTRIYGRVTKRVVNPRDPGDITYVPLPDHHVYIRVQNIFIKLIKTDGDGNYEFVDAPPGKYSISAVPIDGFRYKEGKGGPIFDVLEIELMAEGQVRQDIQFNPYLPKAPGAEPGNSNPGPATSNTP